MASNLASAQEAYDFVIVGGGTAGLCLAARLSENEETSVVVLEAGEERLEDPRINTPALWPALLGSDVDWSFVTEPQAALEGNKITIPHGRVLGGSSAINGQAFVATSKVGIDTWGELGNPGWNWTTLAPYYRKCHTLSLPSSSACEHLSLGYIDPQVSGINGPIQASFPEDVADPLPKAWIATLQKLGYPIGSDPFSGKAFGGYTNAASINPMTRQRSYSAKAYLEPIKSSRSNLKVVTNAYVQRLRLKKVDHGYLAEQAEYISGDGTKHLVIARKEVILCAGTFHSPKILELSGIGGASLLEKHGIPLIIDNPYVGENLQDQVMTGFSFEVIDGVDTKDNLSRQQPEALGAAMESYSKTKTGPLTVGGVFSYAFLPVVDLESGNKPEISSILASSSTYTDSHPLAAEHTSFVHSLLQAPDEGTGGFFTYPAQGNFGAEGSGAELVQTLLPGNFYTIAVSIMHPLSRGYTHITSSDPAAKVTVDPKYMTHPLDLEIMARHVQFIWKIARTEPLRSLFKTNGVVNSAAPKDWDNLDSIKAYVKKTGLSSWHPTSTCAMLPKEKGGVVNPELIVYGTSNVRICDASIMPITTRGNPQSSVYAIAERTADLIKTKYYL